METTIDVRGTAIRRVPPEFGRVFGAVTADGPEPEPVKQWVATAAARVQQECPGRITVDQVRVSQHRPWNEQGDQLPLVYTATVSVTADFDDVDALGSWVLTDGLTVHSVDWRLTDETLSQVEREVRQAALLEAVARAQDYADTIGLGAVGVRSVRDPGVAEEPRLQAMAMRDAGSPQVDFSPQPIEVTAEVHATFVAGSVVAPEREDST